MNKRQRLLSKRNVLDTISHTSRCGSRINYFKYIPSNSEAHERKKFEIFKKLVDRGEEVLTEVEFRRPWEGRADILSLTTSTIIEITHSEKPESINLKRKKYPSFLDFRVEKSI